MSTISIRLPDHRAHACKITRAAYIRVAIEHMNQEIKNKQKQRLIKASKKVRKKSMKINAEFSRIEDDAED